MLIRRSIQIKKNENKFYSMNLHPNFLFFLFHACTKQTILEKNLELNTIFMFHTTFDFIWHCFLPLFHQMDLLYHTSNSSTVFYKRLQNSCAVLSKKKISYGLRCVQNKNEKKLGGPFLKNGCKKRNYIRALQTALSPSPHTLCISFNFSTDLQMPLQVQSKEAMHTFPACAFHSQSITKQSLQVFNIVLLVVGYNYRPQPASSGTELFSFLVYIVIVPVDYIIHNLRISKATVLCIARIGPCYGSIFLFSMSK